MKHTELLLETNDITERRRQRDILRDIYPDYETMKHYRWVIRYNKEMVHGIKVTL